MRIIDFRLALIYLGRLTLGRSNDKYVIGLPFPDIFRSYSFYFISIQ